MKLSVQEAEKESYGKGIGDILVKQDLSNPLFVASMYVMNCLLVEYRIVGNFCGVQFSWMVNLYHFAGLNFAHVHTHDQYVLYNRVLQFNFLSYAIIRENWTPRKFPVVWYV